MSIQESGGAVSYADHDVHHVRHGLRWRSNADSGPTDDFKSVEQFEITERGLDPDELAELRAMRVVVSMHQRTTVNQGNVGTVIADVGAGFNLTDGEFLQDDSVRSVEGVDTDNSGTDDFNVYTADTDEVGQIYAALEDHTVGFQDDTNGVGGAGDDSMTAEVVNFADLFGSGPFVDSADDFSSKIKLQVNDVLETVQCDVLYSLYYDVDQVEGGRSRFGR